MYHPFLVFPMQFVSQQYQNWGWGGDEGGGSREIALIFSFSSQDEI